MTKLDEKDIQTLSQRLEFFPDLAEELWYAYSGDMHASWIVMNEENLQHFAHWLRERLAWAGLDKND